MALTTIQKLRSYLQLNNDEELDNDFLQDIIDSAESIIESYCGKLELSTYTESHTCKHKVFPRNRPLIEVQSITREGVVLEKTNYKVRGNYIEFMDSKIYTMGGSKVYASDDTTEVEITYKAGYEKIPSEIVLAATKLAAIEYKDSRDERLGLDAETEGDVSFTYSNRDTGIPLSIKSILDKYIKVSL